MVEGVCEVCDVDVNWDDTSGAPAPQCMGCGMVVCETHKDRHNCTWTP